MRLHLLLCALLIVLRCYPQRGSFDIQKTYSVEEVLADIDYTARYLLKFHPDPYRYIPEDSLRAFIAATKARINKPLNEMQIRFYLKQIVAKIGCGHTDVGASKRYAKTIAKTSRPVLPLNTYLLEDHKLIVVNNLSKDSLIVPGDEIISIDGHPVDTIVKYIFSVFTTDGYNETYKRRGIRYDWFKYYYSFCYGFKPSYELSLLNAGGLKYTTKLEGRSSLKDTLILPRPDSVTCLQKTRSRRYWIKAYDKPVAVIDIDGFSGRHAKRFYRHTFRDIRRKQINNLVIDLRDNGGGKVNDGMKLLSYLIPETIRVPFDRKPNLIPFNPRLRMDPGTRITPLLFTLFMPEVIRKGRLRHVFFGFPKHRNAYKGNIFVLVNGKSFSMSCIAAAYLKYKAGATVIGEETGGNVAGSNAIINGTLRLPHTRVRVFVPFYHIYHDIQVQNNGHGIMPDHHTVYDKDDILRGADLDMELVKALAH